MTLFEDLNIVLEYLQIQNIVLIYVAWIIVIYTLNKSKHQVVQSLFWILLLSLVYTLNLLQYRLAYEI